jgi:hypothetical protein
MAEDFFKRFDEEMRRRHPRAEPPAEAAPAAPEAAPSAVLTVPAEASQASGGMPVWAWVALALVVIAAAYALA